MCVNLKFVNLLYLASFCYNSYTYYNNFFQILIFDPSTTLEVEIVAHSSGVIWNKADGMDRVVATRCQSLKDPGNILICGDTLSDLPMVRRAAALNPEVNLII